MKRSGPIQRKTPLKQGSQLKRSRLKPMSDKKRKVIAAMKTERADFRKMRCVCGAKATVHEIHGGSSRNETYELREAWLALCWEHHQIVQDWPKVNQYALKDLTDPEHYDRQRLNRLAGWADEAISESEVVSVRPIVEAWIREVK